jgi:D-alanine--poly(phosphoribitol) ligase subunit 1
VIVPKMKDGQPDWLAAFVILAEQPDGSEFEVSRALRRQLGTLLPAYMLPRKFYFLTTFPMTANGKADRKKLAEMIE